MMYLSIDCLLIQVAPQFSCNHSDFVVIFVVGHQPIVLAFPKHQVGKQQNNDTRGLRKSNGQDS